MPRLGTTALILALAAPLAPLGAQGAGPRAGDAITKLERARTANPSSVAALRALGVAYFKADRFADARTVLDQARRLDPKDGVSALYGGLAAEKLGDLAGAKAAYTTYLQVGRTRSVRNDIRSRLVALSREELRLAAKQAVANESALAQQPGSPRTVAVLPLRFTGTDTTLQPLERGLADLLITDLSRSAQLTVLERDRVQAIADELALSRQGRTDDASAVRSGRLIRAGRVVQGAILQTGAQALTVNANVVDVGTSAPTGRPVEGTDQLEQLFQLEKRIAFGIFEQLGIQLTPQERQLVDQRPTRSVQAFLAYSRGLMAEDRGRFDEAARFFENARSIDPSFGAAAARAATANAAALGAQVTAAKVEANIKASAEGASVSSAERGTVSAGGGLSGTLNSTLTDVNPTTATTVTQQAAPATPPAQRNATSQTSGTDQPQTRTGAVTIIIRRP